MSDSKKFNTASMITRPDFARGTMGTDINPSNGSKLRGEVIDKSKRQAIAGHSKQAHFSMGHQGKLSVT